MVEIIQKEGVISKVQLVMNSRISISYYEKLKPFMEELYQHKVQYDKSMRVWRAIKQENVSAEWALLNMIVLKLVVNTIMLT